MAAVLVCCGPQRSHIGPVLTAVRGLVAAGHDVTMLTGTRFGQQVEASGARFVALSPDVDYDDRDQDRVFPELVGTRGAAALRASVRAVFLAHLPGQLRDVRAAVDRIGADIVVTEPLFLGGVAYALTAGRVPVVGLGIFPLLVDSRDTAPFGLGIRPMRGRVGRARNAAIAALVHRVVFGRLEREVVAGFRAATGRDPGRGLLSAGLALDAIAQCTVPEFEYPRSDLPSRVRFVGPLLPAPSAAPVPDWWAALDGRRVVHVTQGTVANGDVEALLLPAVRGLAGLDAQVLASTGGRDPAPLRSALEGSGGVPPNLRIAEWLPYDRLLPRCAAIVTNGGYGGVQAALAAGVPVVVAGRSEDKPEVAARIAWSGAGIDLRTDRPTPAAVRKAVDAVLADGRYRAGADRIARAMARTDAAAGIAALLDELAAPGLGTAPSTPPPRRWV